jgi:hypothetical protein
MSSHGGEKKKEMRRDNGMGEDGTRDDFLY